jgi:hypothetical protein
MFSVGLFTLFIYGLVMTQEIPIMEVPKIREFANGVKEISKLGGIGLISFFRVRVFT